MFCAMCQMVFLGALLTAFSQAANHSYDHYRLPRSIRPLHYTLTILTHLEDENNLRFTGDVRIKLCVLQSTSNITLHASSKLRIAESRTRLQLCDEPNKKQLLEISGVERNAKHDYYILQLAKPLEARRHCVLKLQFCAQLNHKMSGYYVSSYSQRFMSVTQFEPTDARSAFPCFDEPEFKATYNISLGHPEAYQALSNMPLLAKLPILDRRNWTWSVFAQTVPMSSYLVAYSINDFEGLPSPTPSPDPYQQQTVQFTTWARASALAQCHYAAEVGPRILRYYEQMFDIPYPLPKVDQLAVPDFSAGAMENWGLITYRETALFYAPQSSSQLDKQRVANIIAHELAHQWFGNLVTMRWWNDLWLNEGFATYIATLGMRRLCRQWQAYEHESLDNMHAVLSTDALLCTRPISQAVSAASRIPELFDPITYRKGAVVIRMMHMFIGDAAFRAGLNGYLRSHAYSNADQRDLWRSLTRAAHQCDALSCELDVGTIMDTWTLQAGYPLVTIQRNYERNTATVTQSRFLLRNLDDRCSKKPAMPLENSDNCWWIPISYTTAVEANFTNTAPRAWLRCDEEGEPQPLYLAKLPDEDDWIIVNVQLTAPYRVQYDNCNWALIAKALQDCDFERIHAMNRAQLIDDALALAWSGRMHYQLTMELLKYMSHEHDYMPWRAALEQLTPIYRIVRQTDDFDDFQIFMHQLLEPIYKHLDGMKETSACHAHQVPHQMLINQWACRMDQSDCVRRAMEYFQRWYISPLPDCDNPVPRNLRSVVYCTALRHGDAEDWYFLWRRYKNATVASEKRLMLQALGCTCDSQLLLRHLQQIFQQHSPIRRQDAVFAFTSVARSEVGSRIAQEFYLGNFEALYKYYEPNTRELVGLLSIIGQHMSSAEDYELLQDFVYAHSDVLSKGPRSVRRALEQVELNMSWRQQRLPELMQLIRPPKPCSDFAI